MLEEFRLTVKEHWDKLKSEPALALLKRAEVEDDISKPPLYKSNLQLETSEILGSFTVWSSGALEVIIMSRHTGEEIVVDDRELNEPKELSKVLVYYFECIEQGKRLMKCPF